MKENLEKKQKNEGKYYHIITYGCQMNEHQSEKIASVCEDIGLENTEDKTKAELIIFNTCCVRENAENKIIGNIGALKYLKAKKRSLKIVVLGCMTQQEAVAQKLYKTFPFVDIILGTHNLHMLPEYLKENFAGGKRQLEILNTAGQIVEDGVLAKKSGPAAFVNIMYGCNNYCSYCIVPYVRGVERSRSPENIVDEIQTLIEQGVREVTLLGQNVNSYGREQNINFSYLLDMICRDTKIERIRFMTSHPKDLSDELISVMVRWPQICKHIHLPVQSGSTRILDLMNRKYTREDYLLLIRKLRNAIPEIAITTDIIIGFPGETEDDFAQTLSLVESVRFESAFTFVYSKRSGTLAASMDNQVPPKVKKERIMRLVALQNRITEEVNKSYEGTLQAVLVESVSTRNKKHVAGRTESGKTVNFPGNPDMIGNFIDVRITQGKKTTLFGEAEEK